MNSGEDPTARPSVEPPMARLPVRRPPGDEEADPMNVLLHGEMIEQILTPSPGVSSPKTDACDTNAGVAKQIARTNDFFTVFLPTHVG
jgi:hypothetical protein